ncbi:MAG: hypothetical protein NVS3B3_23040 [Aquirhabdus sp.]
MEGLDHWNCVSIFSAVDAAYLVKGIDPSGVVSSEGREVRHIVDSMRRDYNAAYSNLVDRIENLEKLFGNQIVEISGLLSVELEQLISDRMDGDGSHFEFLLDRFAALNYDPDDEIIDNTFEFSTQNFSRERLHEWITNTGVKSAYDFLQIPEQNIAISDRPVATTERRTLLVLIAALCQKANYNYSDKGIAGPLQRMIFNEVSVNVTDDTIRKILRQIPDALEARTTESPDRMQKNGPKNVRK